MTTMNEIREFANSLKSDRLIRIKIGTNENDEPFLISQRTLGSASKYFRKALRQDSFQEGRTGQIDFPEDDYDAWAVLAFWMMNAFNIARKELKPDLLIKCWVLGDKYEIPEFQDQIMLELLFMVQYSYIGDIIRLGSELSPAGSVLKRLIGDEAAVALKNNNVDFESLEAAFNGNGMLRDFLLARDNCEADFDFYIRRFDSLAAAELYSRDEIGNRVYQEWRSPSWQNYMISNGSRPQWLLDEIDGNLRYG
ncbi:hypothetical protein KC343_g15973 [Hortaea werneckii]|uniref:BTB domain-containing protein n=1 Tax=Hortaea werneckii TaxID=91943 RepID=A0A3M7GM76_HORWE|nr:hypothetical protein KC352_g31192 [Hortaea werneckii]KAI7547484.1 hypothetical protein KC317_g15108 [Hortaea werneckii]KAI7596817.1 hypothetical protein KC346_g14970 [Hortaea werneckii]KAI7599607.1 hypothetical protein KC343_g15973 [Hortaea werneckii]KAI7638447.1 hypothetical protein KC319_g14821 [Hortaea werneckii]